MYIYTLLDCRKQSCFFTLYFVFNSTYRRGLRSCLSLRWGKFDGLKSEIGNVYGPHAFLFCSSLHSIDNLLAGGRQDQYKGRAMKESAIYLHLILNLGVQFIDSLLSYPELLNLRMQVCPNLLLNNNIRDDNVCVVRPRTQLIFHFFN